MGTTLTGTTPQDTYDSLIKVTDNGPISGTLKALSDGLGNDSTLSLSTTAASIAGTLAVAGNATFDTNTLVVDATNNRLAMGGATVSGYRLNVYGLQRMIGTDTVLNFGELDASGTYFQSLNTASDTGKDFAFFGTAELMRIKGTGNVGIGTSNPVDGKLVVQGATAASTSIVQTLETVAAASTRVTADGRYAIGLDGAAGATERVSVTVNGLTFNGDTAAANALDDYEEGTWTMGISFGGASVGVTYGANTGAYTKIGRKVTVTGYLALSNKGSSTGAALITGLPFAIGTGTQFPAAAPTFFVTVSYTGIPEIVGLSAASVLECFQLSALGSLSALTNSNFANSSEVYVSFTYFV